METISKDNKTNSGILVLSRIRRNVGRNRCLDVVVDGEKIGVIADNETKEFEIKPGKHQLYVVMDSITKSRAIYFNILDSEKLHVEIDVKFISIILLLLSLALLGRVFYMLRVVGKCERDSLQPKGRLEIYPAPHLVEKGIWSFEYLNIFANDRHICSVSYDGPREIELDAGVYSIQAKLQSLKSNTIDVVINEKGAVKLKLDSIYKGSLFKAFPLIYTRFGLKRVLLLEEIKD